MTRWIWIVPAAIVAFRFFDLRLDPHLQLLEMGSIDTLACATMTIVLQLTVATLCLVPFSRAHSDEEKTETDAREQSRETAAVFDKQVLSLADIPACLNANVKLIQMSQREEHLEWMRACQIRGADTARVRTRIR